MSHDTFCKLKKVKSWLAFEFYTLVGTNASHEAPRVWTITRELSLRKVESGVLQQPIDT